MDRDDNFQTHKLASGVQVVGQPMAGVESAAIGILVAAGARDEDAKTYGIAHFTEQMLFRGTEHLDARQLSDRFDALGIDYDSSAGLEMTLLSAVLLGGRLPQAIDLLADVLRYASFPVDALDNVRSLIFQEISQREDKPGQMVMEILRQKFFADSPLSHDVLGNEESLTRIGREDIAQYWRGRYVAGSTIISVAGNVDWDRTVAQLEEITTGWARGETRTRMMAPAFHAGRTVIERESSQENIGFAFPGVSAADPRYYTAGLLAQAFGGGSNSRLFREVREKRGLAYSVGARFDGLESVGLFRVLAGTSADRAHESVDVIVDELHKLERAGITADELRLAKTKLKSQLVMRNESTSARMAANLRSWWFEQKLHGLQEIRDRIDSIQVGDVAELTRELGMTDKLAVVALGPQTEQQLFSKTLSPA